MKKYLVSGGGKAFRTYTLDVKRHNGVKGVNRKTIRKRNEDGEVYWEKDYYYKTVSRTEEEKEELIKKGLDPTDKKVRYKEHYLGPNKPNGYREDELTRLLDEKRVELKGQNLVCDEETLHELMNIAPDYFRDLDAFELSY